ncbi:hypothetical protein [Brucella cytisi]|nr:hypothetical protein [Brucella cytisi]
MTASIGYSQASFASDWGCEVLLCLSDPRGPTTESECKPPIEKLWRELAKGHSFPSCAMAGDSGSGSGSFARQVYDYYDPCPAGTAPALGVYVAQSTSNDRWEWRRSKDQWSSTGKPGGRDDSSDIGPRACVADPKGVYTVTSGFGGDHGSDTRRVQVYGSVTWQKPQKPRAIDVYIDGALHHRVRY